MRIETADRNTLEDWVALRHALWPEEAPAALREHAASLLADPDALVFLAREGERTIGFAEATIRHDYVNGCETRPVAFVEGLYVAREYRHRGAARALIGAIENWARARGMRELASDALLENPPGQKAHEALGFEETERVVYYRKRL